MKRAALFLSLLLSLGLALPSPGFAQDPAVVARVDGVSITRDDLLQANPQAGANPAVANQTLQLLIDRVLLSKAAEREGLAQNDSVRHAVDAARTAVLAQAALTSYMRQHPVTPDDVEKQYKAMVQSNPATQYRVRIMTLGTREEAENMLAKLKEGESFSNLAAGHSSGPNAALGGELGWTLLAQLQASVGTKLKTLKPGQVVGPIIVPDGWAIVQLLQVRPTEVLPLDAVRNPIEQRIRARLEASYVDKLRAKAHIELAGHAGAEPPMPSATSGEQ